MLKDKIIELLEPAVKEFSEKRSNIFNKYKGELDKENEDINNFTNGRISNFNRFSLKTDLEYKIQDEILQSLDNIIDNYIKPLSDLIKEYSDEVKKWLTYGDISNELCSKYNFEKNSKEHLHLIYNIINSFTLTDDKLKTFIDIQSNNIFSNEQRVYLSPYKIGDFINSLTLTIDGKKVVNKLNSKYGFFEYGNFNNIYNDLNVKQNMVILDLNKKLYHIVQIS